MSQFLSQSYEQYKAEQSQKTWAAYTAQKLVEEWIKYPVSASNWSITSVSWSIGKLLTGASKAVCVITILESDITNFVLIGIINCKACFQIYEFCNYTNNFMLVSGYL
ncbi:hypothetical protein NIES2101_08895 [Calothrix sp. HK-06]|nr:hypothetical protein NIES2101_08895 [Calothrix sp. HK-06]